MTQPLTHDPADRAQHLADSVEDTRTPQGAAEGYVPIFECDDCDPGKVKRDEEVEGGLASFALASLEVALDTTPGSDDDYLYAQESILATDTDGSVPGQVDVTLRDGRRFRITATATRIDRRADDSGEHVITTPASTAKAEAMRSDPKLTAECSCSYTVAALSTSSLESAIREHLNPALRELDEKRADAFGTFLTSEDARLTPYRTALEAYAPLFTEVQHTGGGCMALLVRLGEPQKRDDVVAITDLDGTIVASFWPREELWDEPDDFEAHYLELPEGTEPAKVAAAVVDELVARGVLSAPVAREE